MRITDLFIKRPVLAIVVNLVILIAGLQSIRSLTIRQYPRSDMAVIRVTTGYIGANADLVRGFITTPLERVIAVHGAMAQLKGSYQPVLTLGLMAALGRLPAAVEAAAIDLLSTKASAVATNVPGPPQALYLAGGRIGRLIFWVPQSGDIGLGISILSYAGQVQFGLIADAARVPDPAAVAARFREEFERLVLSVLLGPWLRNGRSPTVDTASPAGLGSPDETSTGAHLAKRRKNKSTSPLKRETERLTPAPPGRKRPKLGPDRSPQRDPRKTPAKE